MTLPWAPIFTVRRSGQDEVTIYGVISVVDGNGNRLVELGDQEARLWTRSVLKPWQFVQHFHILKEHYPALRDEHFALMCSSHNAEAIHETALQEILEIGHIQESDLQNTPLYPIYPKKRIELRSQGEPPRTRWGNCSGKHSGFVMACIAQGQDPSTYLQKDCPHFVRMKRVLGWLLNEDPNLIPETTDGCKLPNYSFTAPKIARLYQSLFHRYDQLGLPAPPEDLVPILENYQDLSRIMRAYAEYIGGTERLDTELMQGRYTPNDVELVAKEGADGVLSVGVGPCAAYPTGLGILIKSSSGDDPRYFTAIIFELLNQLGLLKPSWQRQNKLPHITYDFHFSVRQPVRH